MKTRRSGPEDARRLESDDESEHEKHRRIKSEQERLLRKQLCHLRPAADFGEVDEEAARLRASKD